jgi:oxygen-independent coproporphyrinogen-3 oxidase
VVDFKKFAKFSKPGPRYTSYPTAVEFSEDFTYDAYIESLKSLDVKKDLSLYVHIPFCRSACYFCGCNVVYTSKQDKMDRYLEYFKKEVALLAKQIDKNKTVTQFHFGGGTPTFFSASMLDEVMTHVKSHFHFSDQAEISCEIDPRFFNEAQMQIFAKHGFNRISFGVQDFDEKVQEAVHRIQSYDVTEASVDLARKYGIESINIDLIYGLPFQTFEGFKKTLALTKSLNPDRLAVFNYAHVPWMKKTMRKIDETTLPSPETKLEILKYTIEFFENSDYKMIGMDHFAKENDELFKSLDKGELHRNFQGYTTKGGTDLVGIGLTSIGEGDDYYAQNFKEMKAYEAAIDADRLPFHRGIKLSLDDRIRKSVIMELMANFMIDKKRVEKEFDIDFNDYFSDAVSALDEFVKEDLVTIDEDKISVSKTGTMVVRNIAMPFDAYMKKYEGSKKTFSKTV